MTDSIWFLPALGGLAGILLGLLGGYFLGRRDLDRAERTARQALRDLAEVQLQADQAPGLQAKLDEAQERRYEAERKLAAQEAGAKEREAAMERRLEELKQLREQMEAQFRNLANSALSQSREDFLKQAQETFEKHKATAKSDIEGLVKPMATTLEQYQKSLKEMENARANAYGTLTAELKNVAAGQKEVKEEAAKLSTALRSGSGVRGRWGESQLRRIMELAGMVNYVDFNTEVSQAGTDSEGGDTRQRPDAVITLPANRKIVVDAKAPMGAFLDAQSSQDPTERDNYLTQHAKQVRSRVKELAKKTYWSAHGGDALEAVVMFLPGDDLVAAAVEKDPKLYEEAFTDQVIIATPATLFALARAIAHVWKQEQMTKKAREAAELGRDLYDRITVMAGHVSKLGQSLDRSTDHYNKFVASLERRVLPTARKFEELGIMDGRDPVPEIKGIESTAASLSAPDFKAAAEDAHQDEETDA